MRDVALAGGPACPAAPVRVLEPAGTQRGSMVIFHGLGANRIVMLTNGQQFAVAGFRVFLPDMPGHGDDIAPFSFAAYESCASGLLATLQRRGDINPQRTVLFGHSLGAALVVRLADDFRAAGTIAVATAPLIPPHGIPVNLLLVAPQFDMPGVRSTESHLAASAGTERAAPEDFRQLRAFRILSVPGASHTSALFDPSADRAMLRWALNAVGAVGAPVPTLDYRSFIGAFLGLFGIILLFPATASMVARLVGLQGTCNASPPPAPVLSILSWITALIPAALIAARWALLAALHIYSADYLVSVLLFAGIPLAIGYAILEHRSPASRRRGSGQPARRPFAAALAGAIVGLLTVAAAGAWLNLQIAELWPISARWARLPLLFPAILPISIAEELALGDSGSLPRTGRAGRIGLFVLLRGIVWVVILGAWLSGVASSLLATIFVVFLGLLSVAQRLGADALRHRTGSALAGAVFNAILGAWFLAAAFPLA